MKGIIYTRVSSDEQVKGTSLDFQDEICRKYCLDKNMEILAIFREEGASAKSTHRPEFLRAIEFCRKHKGQLDAFVVAKVDRFARNTEDHFYVRKLLLAYGVSLHSVTEPIGDTPVGKLIETILAGTSDFDNAVRKQRCSDGMSARINDGIYPWKPPIGYACQHFRKQDKKKTEPDLPDHLTFPIIQQGLKEMALGMHSKAALARRLDHLGLADLRGKRTTPQFIDMLLEDRRLKFYAASIYNPWDGEYHPGRHTPMITEEEVLKITFVLSGKQRHFLRHPYNPTFPLRRSVHCHDCERPLTGSSSKGNGGTYAYYHCHNKNCPAYAKAIRKAHLENAFLDYLTHITPKQEWLGVFKAIVIDLWRENAKTFQTHAQAHAQKLQTLQDRRKRIFDMREDGTYSKDEFTERRQAIDNEIAVAKISRNEAHIDQFDLETAVSYTTAFIADLPRLWFDLPHHMRPRFQKLIFPEGISFSSKHGFGTAKLGHIYELNRLSTDQKSTLVDLTRIGWNQLFDELQQWSRLRDEIKTCTADLPQTALAA